MPASVRKLSYPRLLAGIVCALAQFAAACGDVQAQPVATIPDVGGGGVFMTEVDGSIGVGTSHQITQALGTARDARASLLVLRLDTPGGLVASTREIIKAILASPVPVAVYVAPGGARAASAGTYITYAAHIAAMAPGTHLGAATPIQLGIPGMPHTPGRPPQRERDGTPAEGDSAAASERKVVNDAVAFLMSLAELRGRNAQWAEKAVREAATLTSADALKENVVEVVAADLSDLVRQIEGRTVVTAAGERRIEAAGKPVVVLEQDWRTRFLSAITDPNVAFVLLLIGIYGIIFEFWSPGLTGPGVVGAICLLVALAALSVLPVSYAGLGLILLGITLMVGEAFAPGFGILGLGGGIAFMAGALFLFDPAGADIEFGITWPVAVGAAATTGILVAGVLGMAIRARRARVITGAEDLVGSIGEVIAWERGRGRIRLHGEVWSAQGAASVSKGDKVRVVRLNGLTLEVEPSTQGAHNAE